MCQNDIFYRRIDRNTLTGMEILCCRAHMQPAISEKFKQRLAFNWVLLVINQNKKEKKNNFSAHTIYLMMIS